MQTLFSQHPSAQPRRKTLVRLILLVLLLAASAALGAVGGLLIVYSVDLPQVEELERYRPSSITELYDDQQRVIGSFALQRRVVASYEDFSPMLRQAVISTEDKEFERHWGVNLWRILGAAYHDLRSGTRAQGASTLTMQLSRNLFLSPDRTFRRKFQELMLAIQIERRFTKPQIFTLYANQIFLGHGVYGFEAGAQFYFNKRARHLTLEEAALLAALPKAPAYYSPINRSERALRRRNLVINAMLEDGKITAQEATRAKNAAIDLHLQSESDSVAPYFVEEVRQYLEKKYGSDTVHQGGLRVYTTLNLDLQNAASKAVRNGLAAYERRHRRMRAASAVQGALVAVDNASGEIKAMVGGRSFDESKFNRATQALRQVGSAFKPFVYTTVIEKGATPDDVIFDAPVIFPTASGPYQPRNYDEKFEGNITLRRALAQSRNIPALKLAEQVGIKAVIKTARRFGVTSQIPPYLPVALGSAEVTLLEMTSAFSTFPNDGVRVAPRYIRKVVDYQGQVLEENFPQAEDVVRSETARTLTGMLREVVQHGTAWQAKALKHPLGGKTGTTNDFTDAWFIGFSPSMTCGVWIGYDEKKNLGKKETGAVAALPVWMEFMKVALAGRETEDFGAPPLAPAANALARKVDTPDDQPGDGEAH